MKSPDQAEERGLQFLHASFVLYSVLVSLHYWRFVMQNDTIGFWHLILSLVDLQCELFCILCDYWSSGVIILNSEVHY